MHLLLFARCVWSLSSNDRVVLKASFVSGATLFAGDTEVTV